MRSEILELMREQLRGIVNVLSFDNYKEMEQQIHRIFTIIETSETVEDLRVHQESVSGTEELTLVNKNDIAEVELITNDLTMEKLLEEEEEETKIQGRKAYRFERKIRGGMIHEIEAFVPEKLIQELDLKHGDLVYAKLLHKVNNGPDRYEYEIAERRHEPGPEGIIEVNMGIVEYHPRFGRYGVDKTVSSENILLNGKPIIIPLADEDVDSMKIKTGDIINLAYYENNPTYAKVRWRYSVEEQEEISTPRLPSYYKKKNETETKELEKIFANKTICAMGYEPGHLAYKEEVEKRGGTFIGVTGREGADTLSSILKKSNCLVLVLGHVGHAGTIWAVEYCKKKGIPHASIKTFGRTAFVNAAASVL